MLLQLGHGGVDVDVGAWDLGFQPQGGYAKGLIVNSNEQGGSSRGIACSRGLVGQPASLAAMRGYRGLRCVVLAASARKGKCPQAPFGGRRSSSHARPGRRCETRGIS